MINGKYVAPLAIVLILLAGGIFLSHAKPTASVPGAGTTTVTTTATSTATTTPMAAPVPTPTPSSSKKGIVEGTVMLGPTCPVERIPPDPQCADRPYQTSIRIEPVNSSASPSSVRSDASGAFSISLAPGTYLFTPQGGGGVPPTCQPQQVTVVSGKTHTVALSCDTGIR